jgi:carbon storage regulator
MLVLKRKINEKIRIGNNILISIVSVSENQVKIGIDAPDDIKILREEIFETVKQQMLEATNNSQELIIDVSTLPVNKINKKK